MQIACINPNNWREGELHWTMKEGWQPFLKAETKNDQI